MRWVKHLTMARKDRALSAVIEDVGLEGYGLYWMLIEEIASTMDKGQQEPKLVFSDITWAQLLHCSVRKFRTITQRLAKEKLIVCETIENRLQIAVPNILKYKDEYSKKSGQTPDTTRLAGDSDTEAERELTEKQPDGPDPKFSAPEEREPVSSGESLNELEQEIWNYLSPREIRGKRVDLGTVKRLAAIAQKVPGHRQKELWKKIHHTVIGNSADGFGLLITVARSFLPAESVATTNNRVAPPKTANNRHSNGGRKPPGWEVSSEASHYGAGGR